MSIIFNAEDHSYKSIDSDENINWISVTTLIAKFKNPFNAEKVAKKFLKERVQNGMVYLQKKFKKFGIMNQKEQ